MAEHMTEWMVILSNLFLGIVTILLTIVTGMDNHAMSRIAEAAINALSRKHRRNGSESESAE